MMGIFWSVGGPAWFFGGLIGVVIVTIWAVVELCKRAAWRRRARAALRRLNLAETRDREAFARARAEGWERGQPLPDYCEAALAELRAAEEAVKNVK